MKLENIQQSTPQEKNLRIFESNKLLDNNQAFGTSTLIENNNTIAMHNGILTGDKNQQPNNITFVNDNSQTFLNISVAEQNNKTLHSSSVEENCNQNLYKKQELNDGQQKLKKQFRTVGFCIFLMTLGLAFLRLFVASLSAWGFDTSIGDGFVVDGIFTVLMQAGFLFALPFVIYKFVLKKNTKQILQFSYIRRTSVFNIAIAIVLGVCCFVATIGIALLWNIFLGAIGYNLSTSAGGSSADSSLGGKGVLLSLLFVAVFPALCEEFAMRGAYLSTLNQTYGKKAAIIIGAITFGLFHQNIQQLFFTALMGAMLVYITLLTKSIWLAVIVHFANNGIGTYLGYAQDYGWFGKGFFESIQNNLGTAFIVYVLVVCIGIGCVWLLTILNSKDKKPLIKPNANFTLNFVTVNPVVVTSSILTGTPHIDDVHTVAKYKPILSDYTYYFGAFVVTVLATISSYIWSL